MRVAAVTAPVWRSVARVLLLDEAAPAKSIAQVIARSIPTAAIDLAVDGDDLVERFLDSAPDIVFVAIRKPGGTGLRVIERLHLSCPAARIVAVGTRVDAAAMSAAIATGACGFVILDQDGPGAVSVGCSGGWRADHTARSHERRVGALSVTERELQILRGMTDGYSNLEIARQLFVSEDTVKTHARRLFRKLGANDRAHAVALGMRYELVA